MAMTNLSANVQENDEIAELSVYLEKNEPGFNEPAISLET
jgi:hypothetical protein